MVDFVRWTDVATLGADFKTYMDEVQVDMTQEDADDWADCYLTEPERAAWQIRTQDQHAGFALVRWDDDAAAMDLSEFWVKPPFRGDGLGARAAHTVLAKYAGPWTLAALPRPLHFWRRTLAACPGLTNLAEHPAPNPHQAALFTFTMKAPT